jgi:ATP-dependent protease ClpP protease subunit
MIQEFTLEDGMARRKKQSLEQVLFDVHSHSVNLNLRDIYIHSYYKAEDDEEPGVDYRQATTFIKNLHVLDTPPNEPILIHLHSIGGCWDNGMAMFNAVQFSKSYISILAYSQASSMSGIFFQSAPLRVMMPDCHFMLHHGSIEVGGPSIAVKSVVELNNRSCKRMIEIFAERCIRGKYFKQKKTTSVDSVKRFLEKKIQEKIDWFLTADEAVYYGFADGILGSKDYPDLDYLRGEEY